MECGKCEDEKKCCGEVKFFLKRLLLSAIDVKLAGLIVTFRRGLRSSSSLRVVAIQAIDIFIRGCYLQWPDFLEAVIYSALIF